MRRAAALAVVLLGAALAAPLPGHAEIYRYTDQAGTPHYVDGLDNVPAPYRGSAAPIGLRNAPAPAPAPATPAASGTRGATPPGPAATGGTTITYTPGERIMVDVRINGSARATLLLDTGADRTLISPRVLLAAGVRIAQPVSSGTMTGVTGTDRVPYVIVDSLEIGDARVGRMPVASYEMPGAMGDGLLGRDFLDQFAVSIDAARGVVTLTPRK